MKVGDIIYLGDNIAEHVKKPFVDWRGHVAGGDYNGYVKIDKIQADIITVFGLYGSDMTEGQGWIAHPVHYRVVDDNWNLLDINDADES